MADQTLTAKRFQACFDRWTWDFYFPRVENTHSRSCGRRSCPFQSGPNVDLNFNFARVQMSSWKTKSVHKQARGRFIPPGSRCRVSLSFHQPSVSSLSCGITKSCPCDGNGCHQGLFSRVVPTLGCPRSTGVTWAKTIWDYPVIVTIFQISAPVHRIMFPQVISHPVLNPSNLMAE